jgi:hypothetical protein
VCTILRYEFTKLKEVNIGCGKNADTTSLLMGTSIVHGRCALTLWMEGRPRRKESAATIGAWLFSDIICQWGCLKRIITDDAARAQTPLEISQIVFISFLISSEVVHKR